MKKLLLVLAVVFLAGIPAAQAGHGEGKIMACPFMVSSHAKELGLSKDQIASLEKVQEKAKDYQEKIDRQTRSILSAIQIRKYNRLAAEKGMHMMAKGGKKECCSMGCEKSGKACVKGKGKKEQCDKHGKDCADNTCGIKKGH